MRGTGIEIGHVTATGGTVSETKENTEHLRGKTVATPDTRATLPGIEQVTFELKVSVYELINQCVITTRSYLQACIFIIFGTEKTTSLPKVTKIQYLKLAIRESLRRVLRFAITLIIKP